MSSLRARIDRIAVVIGHRYGPGGGDGGPDEMLVRYAVAVGRKHFREVLADCWDEDCEAVEREAAAQGMPEVNPKVEGRYR